MNNKSENVHELNQKCTTKIRNVWELSHRYVASALGVGCVLRGGRVCVAGTTPSSS